MDVDVDSSEEAGTSTIVWPMTGMRGSTLIPGEKGGGREDGGGATVAGGERDIVPILGKMTGEIDDAAAVAG